MEFEPRAFSFSENPAVRSLPIRLEKEKGIIRDMFKNWGLGRRVLRDLLQESYSRLPLPTAGYRHTHTHMHTSTHLCVHGVASADLSGCPLHAPWR